MDILASIIVLLQLAISLIGSPSFTTNPVYHDQVISFANQAVQLANQVILQYQQTQSQQPIVLPDQTSSSSVPNLTPTLVPLSPTQTRIILPTPSSTAPIILKPTPTINQ